MEEIEAIRGLLKNETKISLSDKFTPIHFKAAHIILRFLRRRRLRKRIESTQSLSLILKSKIEESKDKLKSFRSNNKVIMGGRGFKNKDNFSRLKASLTVIEEGQSKQYESLSHVEDDAESIQEIKKQSNLLSPSMAERHILKKKLTTVKHRAPLLESGKANVVKSQRAGSDCLNLSSDSFPSKTNSLSRKLNSNQRLTECKLSGSGAAYNAGSGRHLPESSMLSATRIEPLGANPEQDPDLRLDDESTLENKILAYESVQFDNSAGEEFYKTTVKQEPAILELDYDPNSELNDEDLGKLGISKKEINDSSQKEDSNKVETEGEEAYEED